MPKPFAMPDPKATGCGVADYESQLVCARSGLGVVRYVLGRVF